MNNEAYLCYRESFVASSSDFWWDNVRKKPFGASIATFMCQRYKFKNGMELFMSDATYFYKRLDKAKLVNGTPTLARCPALLDFCQFWKPKTGENIGEWLEEIHAAVDIEPGHIGSHNVDGASNAEKSVECFILQTSERHSQPIVAESCNSHKVNTNTAREASGTSDHVVNMNPGLSDALSLHHSWLVKICGSGDRRTIVDNVEKEHGREVSPAMDFALATRWNSDYDESKTVNIYQYDLETAIARMVCSTGIVKDLYEKHSYDLSQVVPQTNHYELTWQYEGAMSPLRELIVFYENSKSIAHMEFFEARRAIELLSAPFFVCRENVSRKTGSAGKDLTARELNQVVMKDKFVFNNNEFTEELSLMSRLTQQDEIALCRRLAARYLQLRMNLARRCGTVNAPSVALDNKIKSKVMADLEHCEELMPIKIMAAIIQPLFQNK